MHRPLGVARYLTAREAGWLLLYGGGMEWLDIAAATHISVGGIKHALADARCRWDVTSNAALVAAAMRAGVLA